MSVHRLSSAVTVYYVSLFYCNCTFRGSREVLMGLSAASLALLGSATTTPRLSPCIAGHNGNHWNLAGLLNLLPGLHFGLSCRLKDYYTTWKKRALWMRPETGSCVICCYFNSSLIFIQVIFPGYSLFIPSGLRRKNLFWVNTLLARQYMFI